MYLNREEKRMLEGECGELIQKSMDLLVKVGEAYDAERMIEVTYAHLIAWELTDILFELFSQMTGNAKVRIPTTVNPLLFNMGRAKELGIPESSMTELERILSRLIKAHDKMGVIPTYTCHPHYIYELRIGEHVALTESNVVMFANAWLGARSNIEGAATAIASAITGKTPYYGLHLIGNRYGKVQIDIGRDLKPDQFDYADYGALAFWAGKSLKDRIPVYNGLSRKMTPAHAKYMCTPQILHSCAAMFHILGVTPEAPTLEATFGGKKPEDRFIIGKKQLESAFETLCSAKGREIDLVCLGCPHCNIQEIGEIAQLLRGKKVSRQVRLWIGTNEPTRILAKRMGFIDTIENAGGLVFADMCAGTGAALRMSEALGIRTVATNSATLAGVVPIRARGRVGVWFGKTRVCIASAIRGKWGNN
jgi:hypothetical protein